MNDVTERELGRSEESPGLARSERDFSVDLTGEKARLEGGKMEVGKR